MGGKPWTEEQKEAARQREVLRKADRDAKFAIANNIHGDGPIARGLLGLPPKPEPDAEEAVPDTPEAPPEPSAPALTEPLIDEERALLVAKARQVIEEELAAKAKVERAKFLKDELDKEILRQRREAGLTDHRDDLVEFMINVAPFSPGVIIDGHTYPHGSWVTKTRREYDSIRDIMARSWESEERAGNPNKKFEEWRRASGVTNPMLMEKRMPDGSFTLGLDYGVRGQSAMGRTSYNA